MEKSRSYTGKPDTNIDSSQIAPTTNLKFYHEPSANEKVFEFLTNLSGMMYETNSAHHVHSSDGSQPREETLQDKPNIHCCQIHMSIVYISTKI